ncbi:MAG: Ig domain-containing protein, partial [Bacteroidota bacterium]
MSYTTAGNQLNYSLILANTGNVTISAVAVTDPGADAAPVRGIDSPGNNDNLLEEGEVWNYTAVHTITSADVSAGSFTNEAKASGTPAEGTLTDATSSVTVCAKPVLSGDTQLCKGETTTLSSSGTPAASNPWVSASPAVASVTSSGFVTSLSAGSTVITFTTLQGCTETITVSVFDPPTITGPASVCRGAAVEYLGSGTPAASGAWTSSSPAVAIISNAGLLTALASGTTTITYKDINGCTVSKAITVIASSTISGPTEVCKNSTITLTGSGTPLDGSPWTSSDPDIATVDNKGVVTGIIPGAVTIIYINNLGCPATTTITVLPLPVISGDLGLCLGETSQLSADLSPAATNAWVSSVPSVATISAAGLVTSVSAGTTSITYTDNKGCASTITLQVFNLPVISGEATVCAESTVQWSADVAPAASNPWVSSGTAVATVSSTGLITGVSAGTAIITYTDINGCVSTKVITVRALPVVTGDLDVCPGATSQLTGSGTPAASNAWSSSNLSIAGVSSTGLVTGVSAGSVTITYTDINGCQRPVTFIVNPIPVITGTLSVCVGLTTTLETTSAPAAVLPWTSSATAIATVDKNGVVTGVSEGTTTITFTDANGCQGTAVVTVNANPVITGTTSVCLGLTTQLSGTGTPAITNPWISSNTGIATVSETGLVTGVAAGTAVITYTL